MFHLRHLSAPARFVSLGEQSDRDLKGARVAVAAQSRIRGYNTWDLRLLQAAGVLGPGIMTVRVQQIITDDEVAMAAQFLFENDDDDLFEGSLTVEQWRQSIAPPFADSEPNHGYMLCEDDRVVGVYVALYSTREINGQPEQFCNLSTWRVLPEYRLHSVRLLKALLSQSGYHFTDLTPIRRVAELDLRLGFERLDTTTALIPNLPWPFLRRGVQVSSTSAVIEGTLTGWDLDVYRDHGHVSHIHQLVIIDGADVCHVILKKVKIRRLPGVEALYVSNPSLFRSSIRQVTRHLLRLGFFVLKVEVRLVEGSLPVPLITREYPNKPKTYMSPRLAPEEIDYLYSDLVLM